MNSHISITVKVFLIAALAAFGLTGNAHAEPVMDIQSATDGSGWFEYAVSNTTPGSDPDDEMTSAL